ncbi:MAG: DNA primase [Planctomycetota bacterium]
MPQRDLIKDQVLAATDIVQLVGEHVALRPAGREFKGLCPFHDDRNPSMYVVPNKQIFHCFVCGAGGDAFNFAMRYHKLGFREALEMLAQRAGIELPAFDASPQQQAARDDRKKIAEANERALKFFQRILAHDEHGKTARDTIARRGITPEMVEAFQLGAAPERWDGLAMLIAKNNWSIEDFRLAGLLKKRDDGSDYDALRHRLIFPIADSLGRPIAFGGRRLNDEDNPKYLNSPESPLFNKSATLYGLHLAKKAIIDSRTAVLVEGYTDVIAAHQHGAQNVVAALGTALTAQHVRELRRYCDKAVLVMDGDEAGIKAADRALELFVAEGLDVAIAVIPYGQDPDELLRGRGGMDRWNELVEGAVDAMSFMFDAVERRLGDASTVTGRQRATEELLARLAQIGVDQAEPIRKAWLLRRIGEITGLRPDDVAAEIAKRRPRTRSTESPAPPSQPLPPEHDAPPAYDAPPPDIDTDDPFAGVAAQDPLASPVLEGKPEVVAEAEQTIVVGLLHDPQRFHRPLSDGSTLDEALPPTMISDPLGREVYQRMYDRFAEGLSPSLKNLLADLAGEGRLKEANWLTAAEVNVSARCDGKPDLEDEKYEAELRFLLGRQREAEHRAQADPLARVRARQQSAMDDRVGLHRATAIARPRS